VDILKDRNLIKVNVVIRTGPNDEYEEEQDNLEDKIFKIDSTLASFILNDMNKEEIDRYVSPYILQCNSVRKAKLKNLF
jgi:hypothetical protein